MEKEEFEKLFDLYLQNKLSDQELEQFMQAVKTDQYDVFIKNEIYTSLKENEVSDFMDEQQGEIILNKILSKPKSESKLISLEPQRRNRKKTLRLLLAAASIALLAAISSTFLFKSNPEVPLQVVEHTAVEESTLIAFSGKQLIHLPDGSTVLLNDNSSLKYSHSFNGKTREVTLTGEAFFDIKRNEKKAFIVHTGKVQTKVLGTAFNINARNSSDDIEVTVARGKVQVGDTDKIYGIITPNQQIKVNKNTLSYHQNNVSAAVVTEWKSNYLILDDINMEEAVALISQKYKVQILLSNDKIKNCRITASFLNEEDLDHVLKVVCSVVETQYQYNKPDIITIDGKGCE
ncbi:FecR family protein [Flavobacterium sp. MDT1-60]|uniref:FecR family protein n=1 Tax=Flavobacterium sp. MDT1-60 TaxID=1979344 RepID=UPI00177F7F01|nr:FecR family protein [Flavobacterium sp. MDT1-60]QOG02123.1 FecR family protein [Flavobacterium sp. MDT1-60]